MRKMLLMAVLLAAILCSLQQSGSSASQETTGAAVAAVAPEGTIKVTIATGGGLFGPAKSQFKVGEDIPVVISMTNTGETNASYCLSTSLFQNRPQLRRDGKLIPYLTNMPKRTEEDALVQRCQKSEAKRSHELQPRQSRVVDWFKISLMGVAWYGSLPAGHYELVLMRRIDCCQGPWTESNKVAFEIVP